MLVVVCEDMLGECWLVVYVWFLEIGGLVVVMLWEVFVECLLYYMVLWYYVMFVVFFLLVNGKVDCK